mgnify:CR=1 FL=1
MYLYDTEGKEYLDFAAGFAVSGLGYDNKELNQALKDQIDKLYHTSNLYYHESCGEAAQELNRISGMDRVFFTNSGGEANEGALKAARRYAYTKKTGRYEFIAMNNSFHGRSFGAVSVTGHDSYREPFEPVDPTSTPASSIPSTFAASFAVSWQYIIPSTPVHALAIPELMITACDFCLFSTICLSHLTGAAFTTFVVNVPATLHGFSL